MTDARSGGSTGCRYLQLRHVLGDAFGEGAEPLVAASHHRLHAGALLGAARPQPAAALIIACGEPGSEHGAGLGGPFPDPAACRKGKPSAPSHNWE